MKITIEFDNWDEMEAFRASAKKTRGKKEEVVEEPVVEAAPAPVPVPAPAPAAPAPVTVTPTAAPAAHGFPGSNGATPPPAALHPLVAAILARIDGALSGSNQSADAIVAWFRQQIGPDAANATLDQIRQVFIPRMSEAQLRQIAPHLGIMT